MPIQPLSIHSYQQIPDDEDVTPFDRTISKNLRRTEKSFRFIVVGGVLLCISAVVIFFGVHIAKTHGNDLVTIYTTSKDDYSPTNAEFAPKLSMKKFTSIPCSAQSSSSKLRSDSTDDSPHPSESDYTCLPQERMIIDKRTKFQKIIGFGGAFTESAAHNFYKLPDEAQEKLLNLYFGEDGIGLTLGRIHINSCDFSLESYNFDSIVNDFDLEYFDMEVTHDNIEIIPFLLDAMIKSKRPINLVASPWSPPPWMKVPMADGNASMTGSSTPNGLKDDPRVKLAWARYLSKFITAYQNKGVPIWAITPQNEPEFPAPWEACSYNASYEKGFIRDYLGPVLRSEHPDLKILAFDHNKDHLKDWTKVMLVDDSFTNAVGTPPDYVNRSVVVADLIDGMAFHWYGGMDRMTDGTYGYNNLNASYHMAPGKIFLNTEGCSCPGVELGDWLRAERLGHDIIFDLLNYAQGWIDWNLLVDSRGGPNHLRNYCDASMVSTVEMDDVILQPKFFYFGHISKYLTPDSQRIYSKVVGNYKFETTDPNIQPNIELGLFPCEKSVRQMWSKHPIYHYLYLTTTTQLNSNKVTLCLSYGDGNRNYLRLADCSMDLSSTDPQAASKPEFPNLLKLDYVKGRKWGADDADQTFHLVDQLTGQCVTVADGVMEAGGLFSLEPCRYAEAFDDSVSFQEFFVNEATGEITMSFREETKSNKKNDASSCVTAGWPFLTGVAVQMGQDEHGKEGQIAIVVMNEASLPTSINVVDLEMEKMFSLDIPGRSMQTVVY